jgi:hypothetical protein
MGVVSKSAEHLALLGLTAESTAERAEIVPKRRHDADSLSDRTTTPYCDELSAALVDDVIESLIIMRSGSSTDAGSQLSVIASLLGELESRLPKAVADARDQDYRWCEIADRLAMVESTIRRRYSDYVACRKEMPFDDHD